jgi:hypothetical protein
MRRDWCRIFKNQGSIRIPTEIPFDLDNYVCDQPNSIWELIDRDGIRIYSSDCFLDQLQKDTSSLLAHPKDIFLVDRSSKSRTTKSNYGVILMTDKSAKSEVLKLGWEEPLKINQPYSWHSFFTDAGRDMSKIPSNSLIIIDRYLFANFDQGLDNICEILDEILPKTFSGDYHILIISDPAEFKRYNDSTGAMTVLKTEAAATELYDALSNIRDQYPLEIELLALSAFKGKRQSSSDKTHFNVYSDSHNRRIISNTFVIRAEHKLSAIKEFGGRLQSNASQTIWFDANFAGVDKKYQNIHSLPIKVAENIIDTLSNIVDKHINIGRYFHNGVEGKSENIINRLLRK